MFDSFLLKFDSDENEKPTPKKDHLQRVLSMR